MTEPMKQDYEIAAEELREWADKKPVQADIMGPLTLTDEDGWEHRFYVLRISVHGKSELFEWRQGMGIKGRPQPAEVLASAARDGRDATGETFEAWAASYGYDSDSRKAEAVYFKCQEYGRKVIALVGRGDADRLAEWADRL